MRSFVADIQCAKDDRTVLALAMLIACTSRRCDTARHERMQLIPRRERADLIAELGHCR